MTRKWLFYFGGESFKKKKPSLTFKKGAPRREEEEGTSVGFPSHAKFQKHREKPTFPVERRNDADTGA